MAAAKTEEEENKAQIAKLLEEFVTEQSDSKVKTRIGELHDKLVGCLADGGTIFSIVESLKDLQLLNEHELWTQLEADLGPDLFNRTLHNADEEEENPAVREKCRDILTKIDENVQSQQSMLIAAGLPFDSSMEPAELRFQMAIIQFILTLDPVYERQKSK